MTKLLRFPLVALAAVVGVMAIGCAEGDLPPQDAAAVAEEELSAANERLLAAAQAGDATAFAAMFADDGELKFAGEPPVSGAAAIQERAARDFALPDFRVSWQTSDWTVAASADLAVERGTYELGFTTPDGPVQDRGRFMSVWEKSPTGEWKITTDMISSDGPAAAPPADTTAVE